MSNKIAIRNLTSGYFMVKTTEYLKNHPFINIHMIAMNRFYEGE